MEFLGRLARAAAAGALVGLAVGIYGRAFMFVLARLNPEEHGVDTDDGFEMGQFTLAGTVNLLVVAVVIGTIGGLVFLALRGLRFGPAWFRTTSITLGAVVVVGSMLVHSDGVDFTRLEPLGLAVAMTLSMPLVFALGIVWLGDRWLGDGPTMWDRTSVVVPRVAQVGLTVIAGLAAVDLVRTSIEILDGNPYG